MIFYSNIYSTGLLLILDNIITDRKKKTVLGKELGSVLPVTLLLGNYDRPTDRTTDQPTDQKTDRRANRKVTLPKEQ